MICSDYAYFGMPKDNTNLTNQQTNQATNQASNQPTN